MIDEKDMGVTYEPGIDGRPVVDRTPLETATLPQIIERIKATFDEMAENNPNFTEKNGVEINDAGIVVQRESGGDVIFYQPQTGGVPANDTLWIFHTTYPTSNPNLQMAIITLETVPANDSLAGRVRRWKDANGDWRNRLQGFSELERGVQVEARTLLSDVLFQIDQKFNQTLGRESDFDQTKFFRAVGERYGKGG